MDDLISRQAAIELVKDVCDVIMRGCNSHYDPGVGDEVYDDVLEVDAILKCNKNIRKSLKDLPSAQRWIPVGDRLPEERQRCLVTYSGDLVGIAVFTNDLYRFDRDDFMGKKGVSGFVYYDSAYGGYFDFEEVTAWMQLPEPYREEAE